MKMSQHQIAQLWIAEGGDPNKADEWSAISMAESGGDTKAGNSCCHGIAQLNVEVGVSTMQCALSPVCATRKSISLSHNGKDWSPWEAFTNGAYKQFLGKSGIKGDSQKPSEDCKPLGGGSPWQYAGAGAAAGAAAGSIVPFAGTAAGATVGGLIGGVGGLVGGNVLGGCSPLEGANPLKGIDRLAAAVEAIARLIEDMFTAHFWVRFGKGLLGALLIVYALQGMLKSVFGMELPIAPINQFLKSKGLKPPVPEG